MRRFYSVAAIIVLSFACLPCSHGQERPGLEQTIEASQKRIDEAKQALKDRISEYWKALVAGDPSKAFAYVEPSAQNEANRSRFMNGMTRFQFLSYQIQEINLRGHEADVTVRRDFKIAPGAIPIDPGILHQTLEDRWVQVEGTWYAAHHKPALPISGSRVQKQRPPPSVPPQGVGQKGGGNQKEDQK